MGWISENKVRTGILEWNSAMMGRGFTHDWTQTTVKWESSQGASLTQRLAAVWDRLQPLCKKLGPTPRRTPRRPLDATD